MAIVIHHNELSLKGGRKAMFESVLLKNVREVLGRHKIAGKVHRSLSRVVCYLDSTEDEPFAAEHIALLPGVHAVFIAERVDPTEEAILKAAKLLIQRSLHDRIAFVTRRMHKPFPLTTPELHKEYGAFAHNFNKKVDYKSAPTTLYTEITSNNAFLSLRRLSGPGGLPVGSSGKVLSLFSGGIDSPLSSWMMMRRGCRVDFVHFYATAELKSGSKIHQLVKVLSRVQGPSKLFLVPTTFYELLTEGKKNAQLDVVLLRNFMLRVAERIAKRKGHGALIMGDAVGQVASQTLKNIAAAEEGIALPLFRPLVGMNKDEITMLAKKIGTYDLSIQPYKDCCSLIAKNQTTSARLKEVQENIAAMDMDAVVERTFAKIILVKL